MSDHPEYLRVRSKVQPEENELAAPPTEALLHELQVYRFELEMQNENLRQAQIALEKSRDRCLDIYDFSPIALFTLNPDGLIYEMNYAAAQLFGIERKLLLNRRFIQYIAPLDVEHWEKQFAQTLNSDQKQSCHLSIRRIDGTVFPAYLDCIRIENGHGDISLRILLFDITKRERADRQLRE